MRKHLGTNKDGSSIVGVKKVKGASVLGALELLGKYHKMFTDKVEHDMSDELIRKLNEGRARVGEPPIDIHANPVGRAMIYLRGKANAGCAGAYLPRMR